MEDSTATHLVSQSKVNNEEFPVNNVHAKQIVELPTNSSSCKDEFGTCENASMKEGHHLNGHGKERERNHEIENCANAETTTVEAIKIQELPLTHSNCDETEEVISVNGELLLNGNCAKGTEEMGTPDVAEAVLATQKIELINGEGVAIEKTSHLPNATVLHSVDVKSEPMNIDKISENPQNGGDTEILSTCENSTDTSQEVLKNQEAKNYRQTADSETSTDSDDSTDSSSSDESSSVSSYSDTDTELKNESKGKEIKSPKKYHPPSTRGELSYSDLPPIEDLHISLPKADIHLIGSVHAIVDCLVVVQSVVGSPALDLDSVLFLENDKPLGKVFDVLGQVTQPCYAVRFNKKEDIIAQGIEVGMTVFYAPSHEELTSFVFLEQLRKLKGSDASWEHNNEPPERYLDYSDDEEERKARLKKKNKLHQAKGNNEDADEPFSKIPCTSNPAHSTPRRNQFHNDGNHGMQNGFSIVQPPRFHHSHPRHSMGRSRFVSPRPLFHSPRGPYPPFGGNQFERPACPSSMPPPQFTPSPSPATFRHFPPSPRPFNCPQTPPQCFPRSESNFGQSRFPRGLPPRFSYSGANQNPYPLPQWKPPAYPSALNQSSEESPRFPPIGFNQPPQQGPRFPPVGFISNSGHNPSFNRQ